MKVKTLNDLFVDLLKNVYSAETQLVKALPKMAKKTNTPQLKKSFEAHLQETIKQKERLEQIAQILDVNPKGKKCVAMEGLIEEAEDMISDVRDPEVLDAGLIVSGQKVEHYEIASYGTLVSIGKRLGLEDKIVNLLVQTLAEEKGADEKLTDIAETIVNEKAAHVMV
ncbi:MAG TPA: ferritin-like domain-containing protein [Cytophagaceae bacterium]|jgi:ferritin-like metal-binding protein YciE|nr:ferritin-like domain-containing protein [Cytophagaceae bacterium]